MKILLSKSLMPLKFGLLFIAMLLLCVEAKAQKVTKSNNTTTIEIIRHGGHPIHLHKDNCNTNIVIKNTTNNPYSIGDASFKECSTLTTIKFAVGLTGIGNYSFEECINLSSVDIPAGLTTIGIFAFRYCEGLKSITFPAELVSIGMSAFNGCLSLKSIIFKGTIPPEIDDYVFYNIPPQSCIVTIPQEADKEVWLKALRGAGLNIKEDNIILAE